MNNYESVIIINPNVDEEIRNNVIKKITDLINTDGEITKVDELGKKKLAYEVQKCKEAYYVVFYFNAKDSLIKELERWQRSLMKWLNIVILIICFLLLMKMKHKIFIIYLFRFRLILLRNTYTVLF